MTKERVGRERSERIEWNVVERVGCVCVCVSVASNERSMSDGAKYERRWVNVGEPTRVPE